MSQRFYLTSLPESGSALLDGIEAHHLIHVLRARPGDQAELFNGTGLVAQAEITAVGKRDVKLQIQSARQEQQPPHQIIIGTAVPKGDRFDWLVEKATELGVTRLVPLVTARSVVDPRDSKLAKLRQTVIAACKQSGRNHLLDLSPVSNWNDFVASELAVHRGFVAHLDPGAVPLTHELLADRSVVVFAIGPEGGFTDEEVSKACQSGAQSVSLGRQKLRIETAAIAVAALASLR